ncbi:hypothetical protein [Streptomyces sp. JJ38]|uniref:hypothetical protein n=1 Tax=Streptomyces sp. JJ38 TaxID=2738128 RepID=UPI001C55D0B5|nr:hypothetical protein [Streptomyces sp. JJ38]MBW1596401.1 hypothetical protein [Streptomyces sp. JJ38]
MTSYRIRATTLALALVAVLASACGGGDDAPEWTPPQTEQQTHALIQRVQLEPEDWGEKFKPSEDFYEHELTPWGKLDEECSWQDMRDEAPEQTGLQRLSGTATLDAFSQVLVHKEQATAEQWYAMSEGRSGECGTQDYGSVVFTEVRMRPLTLDGVDEGYAESGLFAADEGEEGSTLPKSPRRFATAMARKGPVIISVQLEGKRGRYTPEELNQHVDAAMATMIDRLIEQP